MKKELAVVVNVLNSVSEIFIFQLLNKLKHDFEITCYAYSRGEGNVNYIDKEIKVVLLPSITSVRFFTYCAGKGIITLRREKLMDAYRRFVMDIIKEENIYFPYFGILKNFKNILPRLKNKTIFTSIRGTDITVIPYIKPEVLSQYHYVSRFIDGMHFLSEKLMQDTHDYGLSFANECVIYQGVDTSKFVYNNQPPKDKLRILTIGRLHYIKGLEFAILIANELQKDHPDVDFQLNIIGEGKEREKLQYLIGSLQLQDKVILCGSTNHNDLNAVINKSNVYIHTHLVNGVSNTILEALSANLKVVIFNSSLSSYNVNGLTDIITEVERYNVKDFARILADIYLKGDYGNPKEKIDKVIAKFSVQEQHQRFREFFLNALNN